MQQQRRLVGSELETISSTTKMLSGKAAAVVSCSFSVSQWLKRLAVNKGEGFPKQ